MSRLTSAGAAGRSVTPRSRVDAGLRGRLVDAFAWRTDDGVRNSYADATGWWRDPEILRVLGPGLTALYDERPTVVVGPQSRGVLLGVLAAVSLGVGFVELRKDPEQATDSDRWVRRTAGRARSALTSEAEVGS